MKVFAAVCSATLFVFSASAAQAQNFTFDAAANASTSVGGPDMRGNPIGAAYWSGTSTVTWTDGKKSVDSYICVSMTQPGNDKIFDMHVMCDAKGTDGSYSSDWGCQYLSKDLLSLGCVGGLTGRTGKYTGRGGAITFSGRNGTGSGTGTWGPAGN